MPYSNETLEPKWNFRNKHRNLKLQTNLLATLGEGCQLTKKHTPPIPRGCFCAFSCSWMWHLHAKAFQGTDSKEEDSLFIVDREHCRRHMREGACQYVGNPALPPTNLMHKARDLIHAHLGKERRKEKCNTVCLLHASASCFLQQPLKRHNNPRPVAGKNKIPSSSFPTSDH